MNIILPILNVLFVIILYLLIAKKVSYNLYKNITRDIFKIQSILSPITILYSIVIAFLLKISLSNMGFRLGNYKKGIFYLFIFGIPLFLLAYILSKFSTKDDIKNIQYLNLSSKWQKIYVWLLVGPTEEVFFRGLIQTYLHMNIEGYIFKVSYSVFITSIIFVLFHILNVKSKNESSRIFFQLLPTRFIISVILGYIFQETNSIIYPILIHNIMDGISFSSIKTNT
ncbi:MAG: CPBP family intramembrane metalloprotease [Thermosipho sp. (in: Bacteria)]|nr:CPBP family intramembrane metalloprotease [Thermosipho sp. (in: thermotogales)]